MKPFFIIILLLLSINVFSQITVNAIIINGDTIPHVYLKPVVITEKGNWGVFESWERKRLEKKVRKTLPLAKVLSKELTKRKDNLNSPDKKIRKKELNDLEKYLKDNYTKTITSMTVSEGKVLLKLIHRENNMSPYQTLKLLKGDRKADFWDSIAGLFGSDLESEWDPNGNDKVLEQIIIKVENE